MGIPMKQSIPLCFLALASISWSARGEEPPLVEVTNVRRVFHNGEHNAFTDLIRFRNRYYLTFRSCPDGHMVHPTASVIVLESDDLSNWKQVHRFSVRHRDTRDPHFLVFHNRLFVYTGTWYSGEKTIPTSQYDLNKHLGFCVHTGDGRKWTEPILLEGTFGHYVWRAATYGGKAYLCGRRKTGFEIPPRGEPANVKSILLESDDGLIWRKKSVFQEIHGDETAFLFERDGTIRAIGRRGSATAQYLTSRPPYQTWKRTELSEYVGGPNLQRWGNQFVVGGRQSTREGPRTAFYWLSQDSLQKFAEVPSGGDNSYPGWISLSETEAVISWYSSHESAGGKKMTAIYMANLKKK